jgi:uncharacterized membrane protein YkvI
MTKASVFRRYLLPGFLFQSVVIAGGYGTGAELSQFFLSQGPKGGLLAILVSTIVFSAVSMATFELARQWNAYDYRHFFKKLLGPSWWLFEASYIGLLLVVLAVVAAASGEIMRDTFGLNYWSGVLAVMLAVGGLIFGGGRLIERALSLWSFVLYGIYIVFFIWCLGSLGDDISAGLNMAPVGSGWIMSGLLYAGYNLAVMPPVLAVLRLHNTSRETIIAGALTGPIAMIPGLLFYLPMIGLYPEILEATVPATVLLETLGSRPFQIAFQIVLFGTLIETGTGLIHGLNERVAGLHQDQGKEMPAWMRPTVAIGLLVLGTAISSFGLTDLIAQGYGTLSYGVLAYYVVPVIPIAIWRFRNKAG